MDELSIAMSIVELAEEELAGRYGSTVQAVHMKLGALSSVSKQALEPCFEMAPVSDIVSGKELEIVALEILE